MRKLAKINQSGRTMLEALGYISIMMMVTVSMGTMVNSGYYKFRMSRVNQELDDLKKVVSQRYVAAENYKGVNFQTLIDEKIIPYDTSDKRHAFSGDVKIGPGDSQGTTYFIEFDDLPRSSCVELGLKTWLVNDGSDLDAMKINGKTWGWKFSNSIQNPNHQLPAKPVDVAGACTSEWENDIIWYFN